MSDTVSSETNVKPGTRLLSIDALRGLDMLFISGLGGLLSAFGIWTGTEWGAGLAEQMTHVKGIGLRLYDCIFPIFLFLAGVSWPFSRAAAEARGRTRAQLVRKVLVRVLMLVVLGLVYDKILSFRWDTQRTWPVISRIGLAWGFAAITYLFFSLRTRIAVAVAIFVGYWALLRYVPAPGAPAGVNPLFDYEWNIAWWIDVNYLTILRRHEGGGAMIPMLAHAMLGVFAGSFLMRKDISDARRTLLLFAGAAGLLVVGIVLLPICPCMKSTWTPTYALITTGIGLAFLAAFHWIIDIKGWKKWAFPCIVVGMNSITIYMLWRIVRFSLISQFFLEGIASMGSPEFSKMVIRAGSLVLVWLVMFFLYRKKVFLRV